MFKRLSQTSSALLVAGLLLHDVAAASVLVSGSGVWDNTAPTSTFATPGATWSLGFTVPDMVAVNPTSFVSGFSYQLNGTAVAVPVASIEFFNSVDSGLFDIVFQNGGVVSLYGPPVLSETAFKLGTYDVFIGLDGGVPIGSGSVGLVATSPIPEPGIWAMFGLGLAALVAWPRRRFHPSARRPSAPVR